MADKQIYYPVSPTSRPWKWGARHYYHNCHREGGDYAWHEDNLHLAEGKPKESDINALWTFSGKWDPENIMPRVMPFAFLPYPRLGAYYVNTENLILKWVPAMGMINQKIYFGTDEKNLSLIKESSSNSVQLERLNDNTKYYWRIDAVTATGFKQGSLWHFTTGKGNTK